MRRAGSVARSVEMFAVVARHELVSSYTNSGYLPFAGRARCLCPAEPPVELVLVVIVEPKLPTLATRKKKSKGKKKKSFSLFVFLLSAIRDFDWLHAWPVCDPPRCSSCL